MRNVLVLTATITPPAGAPLLARTDPLQRLDDYARALSFYLTLVGSTFDAIVFAENSGSDLGRLRRMAADAGVADRVEFISFDGLDHAASRGRGYGEFKLVDHVMNESRQIDANTFVWKCTGRYVFENIVDLVRTRPDVDLYCHFRDLPYKMCELWLMGFTCTGHALVIRGIYNELRNDKVPGVMGNNEIEFRALADGFPAALRICKRFRRTPIIHAVRGTNNVSYSGKGTLKTLLRQTAQLFVPWLWI